MAGNKNKSQKLLQNPHLIKRQGKRSYKEDLEIKQLEERIVAGAPARGTNPLHADPQQASPQSYAGARTFDELPISQYTKDGLRKAKYITLTAVQRAALPHALAGRDVLGAAKTGSGKTLAFLIPVVEKLYRLKWTRLDGLGALVLTPTRELAVQIFEELKKVGSCHDLSAGLLIGGKNVKEEAGLLNRMTILVATPGRLLQHMDETAGFNASVLQVLVLDEADRILDMGFSATLDAIIDNLPQERQTMLFSATQTKSVRDLARLSLSDPEYLAVHAEAANPTPLKLQQAYMVIDLQQKMDVLWSFIKTHLKAKTIIFLSTCKQVRFIFEAFRKLRPGVPLRSLHGGMKQPKRTGVFYEYCEAKEGMVLFATDIAARGLDFPTVDWVVQADCPEDPATYIHRVGRTARYMASGSALLLLLPSERAMLAELEEAKVPLKQIKPNPQKQQAVSPALQALLSKDQVLKDFAQKALIAYMRSVFLQPDKAVFDVAALPVEDFAASMGLVSVPKLRFLRRVRGKQQAIEIGGKAALEESDPGDDDDDDQQQGGDGSDEDDDEAAGGRGGSGGSGRPSSNGAADRAGGAGLAAGISGRAAAAGGPSKRRDGGTAAAAEAPGAAPGKDGGKRNDGADSGGDGSGGGAKRQRVEGGRGGRLPATGHDAARGNGDAGDDDDDDDFLVVKKRNVFEAGLPEELQEDDGAGADDEDPTARKKKKKKQKIKVGGVSGNRMVFDEEGNALNPLEALAADKRAAPSSGTSGGAPSKDGVYVVSDRAEDRFRIAADLMRGRDKEDRERLRKLRKDLKLERKDRQRAAAAGMDEDDEDDGGPVTVTLGRAGGGGRDHAGNDRDAGGSDSGSGSDDGSDDDQGGRRRRSEHDESDGSSSDEDGGGSGGRRRGGAVSEVAHAGMARKGAAATGGSGKAGAGGSGGAAAAAAPPSARMSLAEQEALALKMLTGGGARR